ncbi:hypothetical protein VN0355_12050 [Helicobacter pylori]|nr:hypothetical protein VN0355_12050 [Helicobacter pylori]
MIGIKQLTNKPSSRFYKKDSPPINKPYKNKCTGVCVKRQAIAKCRYNRNSKASLKILSFLPNAIVMTRSEKKYTLEDAKCLPPIP